MKNKLNIIKNGYISRLLWLLPVIYGLIFITIYSVNFLANDEYYIVDLAKYIDENGFFKISTFKKLFFSQLHEHKLFFPSFFLLIVYKLTNFNSKIALLMIQFLVIINYLFITKYYSTQEKIDVSLSKDILKPIFIFLSGIALYSSVQYHNFLTGWQFTFYMAIFCPVASLYFFNLHITSGNKYFCILSIISGFFASFSSLHGLFVWPVIIILFLFLIYKDRTIKKKCFPYLAVGICCYFFYFYNYEFIHYSSSFEIQFDFIIWLKNLLGLLGSFFTGKYSIFTLIFGAITLLYSIFISLLFLLHGKIKNVLFPIGLIGFGYASLLSIAVGRSGSPVEETANASRYMSLSCFVIIGILMLVYKSLLNNSFLNKKYYYNTSIGVTIVLGFFILTGNFLGLFKAKEYFLNNNKAVSIIQNYEINPIITVSAIGGVPLHLENLGNTYDTVMKYINYIKKNRASVFSTPIPSFYEIPSTRFQNMKKIELKKHDKQFIGGKISIFENYFYIYGWVIDYLNEKEYTQVYIRINNKLFRTRDQIETIEVANHFNNKKYKYSGFDFFYPLEYLNSNEYYFSVVVILNDGISYLEIPIVFLDDQTIAYREMDQL